jgi:shikimate kinase
MKPSRGVQTSNKGFSVFLVGYMCAGKTTVGRSLAEKLGWRFVDLDERIETRQGRDIAEIFRVSGEPEFRRAEHHELRDLLKELENSGPAVVALGGGTFMQEQIRALIQPKHTSIFLEAPIEELWARANSGNSDRPLAISENQFRQLYESRRQRYMEADLCMNTAGKTVDDIVAEILAEIEPPTQLRGER